MIRLIELVKRFADPNSPEGMRTVLDGFSLEVPEGQVTILLGRSGSGKSVILKHIVGLIQPDSGRVEIDDTVVDPDDSLGLTRLRQQVGFVFQFAALFDSMTVAENIRLGLLRRGLGSEEIADRLYNSLEVVGMAGSEERYPGELSGGMRKRIGIARAVALQPRYILWDEPTSGLDPVTSATIDRLIRRVSDQFGTTGLVVTHDMRSAFGIGDRVAMLDQGKLRISGTVAEIKATTDPVVRGFIEGLPE